MPASRDVLRHARATSNTVVWRAIRSGWSAHQVCAVVAHPPRDVCARRCVRANR